MDLLSERRMDDAIPIVTFVKKLIKAKKMKINTSKKKINENKLCS
jgi:hypothetical protein